MHDLKKSSKDTYYIQTYQNDNNNKIAIKYVIDL